MAAKKKTSKTSAPAKKSKMPKIKDLSPKKNPRGGDAPHRFPSGGGSSDE